MTPVELNPAQAELLNTRCDVVIGSCSAARLPSVCWGMGGRVHGDRRRVTVWLRKDQAGPLLDDVAATGAISAVFNVPVTLETLQLKGRDASIRAADGADAEWLHGYIGRLVREIALVQFDERFARAAFEQDIASLIAIEFTIAAIFMQTPGPQAGQVANAHGEP